MSLKSLHHLGISVRSPFVFILYLCSFLLDLSLRYATDVLVCGYTLNVSLRYFLETRECIVIKYQNMPRDFRL